MEFHGIPLDSGRYGVASFVDTVYAATEFSTRYGQKANCLPSICRPISNMFSDPHFVHPLISQIHNKKSIDTSLIVSGYLDV